MINPSKKTSEMGIICKNSDEEYVNTHKQNKMFYCDLGAIGLMDNVDGKWKEVKYLLKDCKKKRAVGEEGVWIVYSGNLKFNIIFNINRLSNFSLELWSFSFDKKQLIMISLNLRNKQELELGVL